MYATIMNTYSLIKTYHMQIAAIIFPFLIKLFGSCVHRSLATVSTPEGKHMVSIETLRDKNLPQALDSFLFNLAVAENIMML